MIRNYLKVAFRNLTKNKLFSLTNIFGLAVGILCCTLILFYVTHELSFDQWNGKADRIVRVYTEGLIGGNQINSAESSAKIAEESAAVLPDIENWCRFRAYGSRLIKVDGSADPNILVEDALSVDSTFFALFPVPMVIGDARTTLTEPNSVSISSAMAEQLFGDPSAAIGQALKVDNGDPWKVTSVFHEIPVNSHFAADLLFALNGNSEVANAMALWAASSSFHTYLLLRSGTNYEVFKKRFLRLSYEKVAETIKTFVGLTTEELEASGQYLRLNLQPLNDIHLYSNLDHEIQANGNIQYVRMFTWVAFFVLLIACINFMNLTTARSNKRMEEIAVRKVLGSTRRQLVNQFLAEAFLTTTAAVVISVVGTFLLIPWFADLTGRELQAPWTNYRFWLSLLAGTGIVSLMAGSYPALFLSRYKPIDGLRKHMKGLKNHQNLRSGLVIFQFAVAIILIIGTFLVYQQIGFMQNKNLGYDKDQVVVVNDANSLGNNLQAYRERMLQHPSVKSATVSSFLPIPSSRSNSTYSTSPEFRQDNMINMQQWWVDQDYLRTLGLKMAEGRFFDRKFPSDSSAIILNQAAADVLQFEEPIGQRIFAIRDDVDVPQSPNDFKYYTVIGVVEDFHFESLRQPITALAMFLGNGQGDLSLRFESGATASLIDAMESNWRNMTHEQPFSYRFLDESFGRTYEAEQRIGTISLLFAVLAILVSCLGLFGLSTFVVEQRTKEIGIRKILGASVLQVVGMLSTGFLKLVLLSLLLAIPISWYVMSHWLTNFAYRIEISWWVFAMAACMGLILTFITVSLQSTRAALSNPIESIRVE